MNLHLSISFPFVRLCRLERTNKTTSHRCPEIFIRGITIKLHS